MKPDDVTDYEQDPTGNGLPPRADDAPEADPADDPEEYCPADHDGWACTNLRGHAGLHIARGTSGSIYARWRTTPRQ